MKELIANNLKKYRQRAGLRQADVAKLLNLQCEDRLSHWERGRAMPSAINLMKLCKVYGVRVEDIYDENPKS